MQSLVHAPLLPSVPSITFLRFPPPPPQPLLTCLRQKGRERERESSRAYPSLKCRTSQTHFGTALGEAEREGREGEGKVCSNTLICCGAPGGPTTTIAVCPICRPKGEFTWETCRRKHIFSEPIISATRSSQLTESGAEFNTAQIL